MAYLTWVINKVSIDLLFSHLPFVTGIVALLLGNQPVVCLVTTGFVGLVSTEFGEVILVSVLGVPLVAS